jgi:hypothetical protein
LKVLQEYRQVLYAIWNEHNGKRYDYQKDEEKEVRLFSDLQDFPEYTNTYPILKNSSVSI